MAPEILNQEEVDSLLDLMNQTEPSSPQAAEPAVQQQLAGGYNLLPNSDIHPYDFKRPERLSKEQAVALQVLHESCARNLSASFTGYVGTILEVNLNSVEQVTHSEFPMSLPSPSSFNLVAADPLEGNMILEMNPSILFPIIDRLLGGGNTQALLLDRPFTGIELTLVDSVLERVIDNLNDTWDGLGVAFRIIDSAPNPFLLQIVAPNEPVVLVSFEVIMGEYSGMINCCIPFKMLEPVLPQFSQSSWLVGGKKKGRDKERIILESIAQADFELSAILAETRVSMGDILELSPGDLLDTGKARDADLTLAISGVKKFRAAAGIHRDRKALRIREPVEGED